ncbi:YitT family protein [Bulleidia sp. zg-1006]|uniref:YczE/YyaS/YitT family protein n=1 Tax=Bulleidia sp. zg-1006 TaxID=2806552 RepID=UPI001939F8D8|nr:hypothetical protein [Bulleidia sp. zg-1006]QRG87083.1 hypothetical protein JOS54_01890 [Bulleidia sp. zg-1006]
MEIQIKHFWKHLLVETVGVIILSIGGAGIMKAGLGNSAYDAFSMSISLLSHIEVGTIATVINLICVLVQMILLRRKYKPLYLLQIFVSIVIGVVVNLFYYHIFDQIVPDVYALKLVWFIFFVLADIFGISLVVASGMISLAMESTCMVIAKKYHLRFSSVRFVVDVFFFSSVFVIWYFFHIPLSLREGTVILMFLFSPLVDYGVKYLKPILHKWIYEQNTANE